VISGREMGKLSMACKSVRVRLDAIVLLQGKERDNAKGLQTKTTLVCPL